MGGLRALCHECGTPGPDGPTAVGIIRPTNDHRPASSCRAASTAGSSSAWRPSDASPTPTNVVEHLEERADPEAYHRVVVDDETRIRVIAAEGTGPVGAPDPECALRTR